MVNNCQNVVRKLTPCFWTLEEGEEQEKMGYHLFTSQKYFGPIGYICSCTTSEYEKNCNTCIGQYLCGIYIDRELLFILTQTYNRSVNELMSEDNPYCF